MKVYIFILKKFYLQNNFDMPMAINNDDVKVFSDRNDAEIYRSNLFEEMKSLCGDRFAKEEIHTKEGNNFLALHFRNGTRFIFEIIEKSMISNLLG